MGILKTLNDSYYVFIKEMIEFRRNKMELASLAIMPLIFLVMFGFIFPTGGSHENVQM